MKPDKKIKPIKFKVRDGGNLVAVSRTLLRSRNISESLLLNSDIHVNGVYIHHTKWESLSVKTGDKVEIFPNVYAGAIAAAIVAAVGITAGTTAAVVATTILTVVISAALSFAISWAISKLFPAAQPKSSLGGFSVADQQSLPTITGANNSYRPFEPLPVVVGTCRAVPDFAVPYYSVISGTTQKIRHLFCVSQGDVEVWDIRKDDTPIENLSGIKVNIYRDWRGENFEFFNSALNPIQEQFLLSDNAVFSSQSPVNTVAFGVILSMNGGLRTQNIRNNNYAGTGIKVVTKFKEVNTGQELSYTDHIYNSNGNLQNYRAMINKDLPKGSWSVQISAYIDYTKTYRVLVRTEKILIGHDTDTMAPIYSYNNIYEDRTEYYTAPANSGAYPWNSDLYIYCDTYVAEIQWPREEKPILYTGQSMTFIEIEATASDALTGGLNTINCMARMLGKNEDGTLEASSNIAKQCRRIMTDPDLVLNTEYVHLHKESFARFEEHCEKYKFTVNAYLNDGRALGEVISDMVEIGQGYMSGASGEYEIFFDDPTQPLVDVITSRNSWGLTIGRAMNIVPVDGIRVNFNNNEKDYQIDERLVPWEEGVDPKNAQQMSNVFIDNSDLAYKYGKINLAMAHLRGNIYKFSTDWRSVTFKLGQKIKIQHPLFFLGIGCAGKVLDYVRNDNGGYEAVVLDQSYSTDLGSEYVLQLSSKYQTRLWDIKAIDNETTHVLYFVAPIYSESLLPEIGQEFVFGLTEKVGIDVLIRNITRNVDFTAEVECLPSDMRIYEAIEGPIPPFESSLTFPTIWDKNRPYMPTIIGITLTRESVWKDENGVIKAQAELNLQYKEKIGVSFGYYKIYLYSGGQELAKYEGFSKTSFTLPEIQQGVSYSVIVVAVSAAEVESSEASINYYSHELMEPISVITGLSSIYEHDRLALVWDSITDWRPFEYQVRKGINWGTGQIVSKGGETSYSLSASGVYWVGAVSGLVHSTPPTSIEIENVSGIVSNVIAVIDEDATLWDGITPTSDFYYAPEEEGIVFNTNTGGIYENNDIYNSVDVYFGVYTGNIGYYYVSEEKTITLEANYRCNITLDLEYVATSRVGDIYNDPDIYNNNNVYGIVTTDHEIAVEIMTRVNGVWGEWTSFTPRDYIADGFKFRLRAETDQEVKMLVKTFRVYVDVPDKVLSGKINVPVEGLTIPFVPPFNAVPHFVPSILDGTNLEDVVWGEEDITKNSITVKVLDKNGESVAKTINYIVQGY